MAEFLSLKGKKALICGASQGIGEASAKLLAAAGAQVTIIARRQDDLDRVKRELVSWSGADHRTLALDLSQTSTIAGQLKPLLPFDIIVHNVAGPKAGSLINAELHDLEEALKLHLYSAQMIAKICIPSMQNQKWGRWINIISTSVKVPINNLGVSNTVRGAMASWSKTMANEMGPFGITFNNILPGFTRTPRFDALKMSSSQQRGKSVEEVEREWVEQVPLRRIAEPKEIAQAVLFLASPEASYINGINLPVDGGRTPTL